MSFQINVKNKLQEAEDHFGAGDVYTFSQYEVWVGKDSSCDCTIQNDSLADKHFCITEHNDGKLVLSFPDGNNLFVNDKETESGIEILSGDDIRIEHLVLKVQKIYHKCGLSKGATLLAKMAIALVVLILIAEFFMAVLLPKQAYVTTMWQKNAFREKVVRQLDRVSSRGRVAMAKKENNEPVKNTTYLLIDNELGQIIQYVRKYELTMSDRQWSEIYQVVQQYDLLLTKLDEDKVILPIPEFKKEEIFKKVIEGSKQ